MEFDARLELRLSEEEKARYKIAAERQHCTLAAFARYAMAQAASIDDMATKLLYVCPTCDFRAPSSHAICPNCGRRVR